ncbi:MAG: hypothetical protein RIB67_04010 [Miltoncostaeaceae bacterium]
MAVVASPWSARIHVGGLPVEVASPGGGPEGWPSAAQAHITGCADASTEGPPAAGRAVLTPAPGFERAYLTMAAALAADDTVGLLGISGGREYRLRSLGEALVVEWGVAASPEEARGFTEAELAGALLVLRSLPRRLPVRPAADGAPTAAGPAPVVDLTQVRRARGL